MVIIGLGSHNFSSAKGDIAGRQEGRNLQLKLEPANPPSL
jgi:hypothetical protein